MSIADWPSSAGSGPTTNPAIPSQPVIPSDRAVPSEPTAVSNPAIVDRGDDESLDDAGDEGDAPASNGKERRRRRTATAPSADRIRNRLREVRVQQGMTLRALARQMGRPIRMLREEEDPQSDLTISQLRPWQDALGVPLVDLLVEPEESLSRPVHERAKMVRVMKTAATIREQTTDRRTQRLGEMLCEQLVELMPELATVAPWPTYGQRRGPDDVGRLLSQPIPMDSIDFSQLGD
jgi:transcriptional regulator with XRE-family HTH domain